VPFINERDREAIKQLFDESLVNPVSFVYFTMPKSLLYVPGRETCETCDDVQELLEEIVGIAPDKLSLKVHDLQGDREAAARYRVDRVPALILHGSASEDGRLRYFGAPMGSEFPNLIHDIVAVSRRETGLSDATRQALSAIPEPIHLQVFVTPT
jgi:glutaredoxin-like protein